MFGLLFSSCLALYRSFLFFCYSCSCKMLKNKSRPRDLQEFSATLILNSNNSRDLYINGVYIHALSSLMANSKTQFQPLNLHESMNKPALICLSSRRSNELRAYNQKFVNKCFGLLNVWVI